MAKKTQSTKKKKKKALTKKTTSQKKVTRKKTSSKKSAAKKSTHKKAAGKKTPTKKNTGKKPQSQTPSAGKKSPALNMKPPTAVRRALKKGLELAPEHGGPGLVPNTLTWARKLADGQAITPAKANKMHAYFSRHKVDKRPHWDNPPTPGYVAWLLWGGDAGKTWSTKLKERLDK